MKDIQASEFTKETHHIFEKISKSLDDLKTETGDKKLFYKHYLYWHEIKSLATLFSLTDIAALSHEIELLFDQVSNNKLNFSEIDCNCFDNTLEFINLFLENCINGQSHSLDFESLLISLQEINNLPAKNLTKDTTPDQTQTQPMRHPKVLIIEDEPINMTLLEASIKSFDNDFEVILADSAEEGLFHFFTKSFDLIFLDIMMPVIDGNDFIAIIEKNIEKKNITSRCNIVVQTAIQSIDQLTSLAKKECVQEIIRKPIPPQRINECLNRYCIEPYNFQKAV